MTQQHISFHPEIEASMRDWLEKRDAPAFLLLGPPGVGKTTLTYRVSKENGFFIKEYNASHVRTGSVFKQQLLPQLAQNGITSLFHVDCPKGKLLLLDEIDGMSQGERGGLQELLTYLRQKVIGPCPLVLICNEIRGRTMQQLQKICRSHIVQKPQRGLVENYLGKNIPDAWYNTGDLRRMLRWSDGIELTNDAPEPVSNQVTDPNHSQESLWAAWHTLYEEWEQYEELELETKDTNLAGLLFHENLPKRLTGYSYDDYLRIFDMLNTSDRADYWAFFHQCWNLLTPSYVLKLKLPNLLLTSYPIKPQHGKIPTSQQLQYTQVLTKQSLLFNVWKEMCRLFDTEYISIRVQPTFVAQPGIPEKTVNTIGLVGEMCRYEDRPEPVVKPVAGASKTKKVAAAMAITDAVLDATESALDAIAATIKPKAVRARAKKVVATAEVQQDIKKKKPIKKSDVQGAVLVL
jgi:hypothetical protein